MADSIKNSSAEYSKIDPCIEKLSSDKGALILVEDGAPYRRYFYVSDHSAKTVQVVVEPEEDCKIRIELFSVEEISHEYHVIILDSIENCVSALLYAYEIALLKVSKF